MTGLVIFGIFVVLVILRYALCGDDETPTPTPVRSNNDIIKEAREAIKMADAVLQQNFNTHLRWDKVSEDEYNLVFAPTLDLQTFGVMCVYYSSPFFYYEFNKDEAASILTCVSMRNNQQIVVDVIYPNFTEGVWCVNPNIKPSQKNNVVIYPKIGDYILKIYCGAKAEELRKADNYIPAE